MGGHALEYRIMSCKKLSLVSVTVTIQPDYCFIVEIGGHRLDKCPSITTTTITCLDLLMTVLGIFDNSNLCIGNPDEKFESAQIRRNGKFLNHTGLYMYIITYYKQYIHLVLSHIHV